MKFVKLQKNLSQLVAQNTSSLNFFYNTVEELQKIEALLFNEILSITNKQTKLSYNDLSFTLVYGRLSSLSVRRFKTNRTLSASLEF